jgi:hypothetical protein
VHDSRARIWFALFVLAVFCLGGAGGFVLGRHVPPLPGSPGLPGDPLGAEGRGPRGRIGGLPPLGRIGGPVGLPPEAAGRLANELGLDETQREQLRVVLDAHRAKFEQVHRDARDRFDAEQRELYDAIRAILRPVQAQRFDQFFRGR